MPVIDTLDYFGRESQVWEEEEEEEEEGRKRVKRSEATMDSSLFTTSLPNFRQEYNSSLESITSNINVSLFEEGPTSGAGYSYIESIVIAVVAGILSLLTIFGNVLVMVSFKLDKQLQTISNYFLLSLAGKTYTITYHT